MLSMNSFTGSPSRLTVRPSSIPSVPSGATHVVQGDAFRQAIQRLTISGPFARHHASSSPFGQATEDLPETCQTESAGDSASASLKAWLKASAGSKVSVVLNSPPLFIRQ